MITHNPQTIAPPAGRHSHGIELQAGARILYISGQVGSDKNGVAPVAAAEQARIAWWNIIEVLRSASMEPADIVKLTTYLTNISDAAATAEARSAAIGIHAPASTIVVVSALMRLEWKIEIEAIAARL